MDHGLKERTAIIVQIKDSPLFEEAHLIFKKHLPRGKESDMVMEANRIIALADTSGSSSSAKKQKKNRSALFYFLSGMLCALVVFVAGALFFGLICNTF